MPAPRSPRYPNIPLSEAISRARQIYEREHMSPLSPTVAAEAMGYNGRNGTSLKVISSLRKFGLLEGRGDDVRISKDAQTLIIDDPANADYQDALRRCALMPELFAELRRQFPSVASDRNISVFLEKQGFIPDAAALAAKNFRESMALLNETGNQESDGPQRREPTSTSDGISDRQATAAPASGMSTTDLSSTSGTPIRVVQNGKKLEIAASVDLKGLRRLKKVLDQYESLLEMLEEDEDELT